MLVQIGKQSTSDDVVDLLHECHGRIRRFLVMARQLALALDASHADICDTAAQIRRYFRESFPLHVADEEIDVGPRVASALEVDHLLRMHADHRGHSSQVAELIALLTTLENQPQQHASIAVRLHALSIQLATELESHMEFEERTIFPALRALPLEEREAVLAAMRRRRSEMLGGGG